MTITKVFNKLMDSKIDLIYLKDKINTSANDVNFSISNLRQCLIFESQL